MVPTSPRPELPVGRYLVAGLGRAGLAAGRRLVSLVGPDAVTAWDGGTSARVRDAAREFERAGVQVVLGGDGLRLLDGPASPSCVVKSPGMTPQLSLFMRARQRGIEVIDELELGWRADDRPVVAVTGTNGKSTVSMLAAALLQAAGARPALAGNVHPGPPFSGLAHEDADIVVCEASSFQLEGCPAFLPEIAVFTNLTHEHLDRHLTMRRYGAAKRRMFVRGRTCATVTVVNIDDDFGATLAEQVGSRGGTVVRYGKGAEADYRLTDCRWTVREGWLSAETPRGSVELSTRLPGAHNAHNALAALALADALDVAPGLAESAIGSASAVPGRLEVIDGGQAFDVVIDYAHNPDGIRRALEMARAVVEGRGDGSCLRVVCSAPRIRLRHQRRMMGRIAAALADHLVLTTERWPETDAAVELPDGLAEAAFEHPRGACEIVLDREDAIECAVRAARPDDVVMILGRGNLSGELLDRDGRRRAFDDRQTARRVLARRMAGSHRQ